MSERCLCCQGEAKPRDPDPWEGRMDGYCEDCAWNRCDCYPDECPVKHNTLQRAPRRSPSQMPSAANVLGQVGTLACPKCASEDVSTSFQYAKLGVHSRLELMIALVRLAVIPCPCCTGEERDVVIDGRSYVPAPADV